MHCDRQHSWRWGTVESSEPRLRPLLQRNGAVLSGPPQPTTGRRILIIEDYEDTVNSLREVLELEGYLVEGTLDGREGTARARSFRPEIVLCDLGLPGMDGLAVARAFRTDRALARCVLIARSGYAQPEDVRGAIAAGFRCHLAKPMNIGKRLTRTIGCIRIVFDDEHAFGTARWLRGARGVARDQDHGAVPFVSGGAKPGLRRGSARACPFAPTLVDSRAPSAFVGTMRPVFMGNPNRSLSLFLAAASILAGCGGKSAAPVKSAAPDTETVAESRDESPPEKSGPNCSDGTCIACGDAECPKGFFCDESTSKPSCQWVPTCADSVSCSCVERSLSGSCSCTERDGGSYVRCES